MKIRSTIAVLSSIVCMLAVGCANQQREQTIASPDGHTRFQLNLNANQLRFKVTREKTTVIEDSPLNLTIDGQDLTRQVRVGDVKHYKLNETYASRGVHSRAVAHCNGTSIELTHTPTNTRYTVDVRAFDDGVAFRFVVAGRDDQSRVPDELTTFTVPAGSTIWSHNLRGHYEGTYEKKDVAQFPAGEWAAPPMTFKLPDAGGYASITEANLVNYSGMALEADGNRGFRIGLAHRQPVSYPYELRYSKADIERLSHPAAIRGTITTPWRVVMIGKDLNTLVNCDMVQDLCPPPDKRYFPTDWTKPGRAVWRYLDNSDEVRGDPGAEAGSTRPAIATTATRATSRPRAEVTLAEAKRWSEWAGQLGFEYNILEGFWRRFSDADLRELVNYSRDRGVGIFVWVHSKELRDPEARRTVLKRCHDLGIAGLKVDFFDHEHKEVIDLYHAILRESAEQHLLLDFHGANKPTGESRTWPNELVREAIRGMEARSLTARASHETTLPFTRFLAGHAEYTGMLFSARRGDTTIAHQIAVPIVFTAPLLTFGAHPQNILNSPAVDLIKSIPSTWDETIVLPPSELGELAVFARRKGGTWFLAVLNGPTARSFTVPLKFLGGGTYHAMIVRDADDGSSVTVHQIEMRRADSVRLNLTEGGGFVARFTQ